MNHVQKEKYLKIVNGLIKEAAEVKSTQFVSHYVTQDLYVDLQTFHRWWGKIKSLGYQLGTASKPWNDFFTSNPKNSLATVDVALGTVESIKHELENDYLLTITQLVKAETMADLLGQAEHLTEAGYHLGAGVIGRAVLEEHLRDLCKELECPPNKKRPTINDYNLALYGIEHYSKIKMKQIDSLASIGNDAAHNKPNLSSEDIKKLIYTLPEIIETTKI